MLKKFMKFLDLVAKGGTYGFTSTIGEVSSMEACSINL